MSEEKPEYLTEAEEMLGKGYESVRIEPERSVIRRVNGKMESYDLPAFVKISTSFKSELAEISGDALKVWLFIALSINRKTGKANPGLRTISENVKLAVNTVQKCLQELENLNLLTVDRQSRKFNIYETPEYVSANRAEPTVSNRDTDAETVSNLDTTVSNFGKTVSPSVILNQSNQKNQKNDFSEIVSSADKKMDAILAFERQGEQAKQNGYWHGQELFPPHLLPYANWWNSKTGQVMKVKPGAWLKEFTRWYDEELTTASLDEAFEHVKSWKKIVEKPADITSTAKAINDSPKPLETIPQREEGRSSGYYA